MATQSQAAAGRSIAVARRPVTRVCPEQPEQPAMARVSSQP